MILCCFLWWLKVFFSLDGWTKRSVIDVVSLLIRVIISRERSKKLIQSQNTLQKDDPPLIVLLWYKYQAPLIRFLSCKLTTLIQRGKQQSFWIVEEAKSYKGKSLYCILSTVVFKLKQSICFLCKQKTIFQQGLRESENHPLLYMSQ